MPNKRMPKSYYFSNLYSSPFHRNEDRIGQVDLRTFDPFVPESRQTVANCKKHRRQRHELSDKCKHVLAIVDAQENLLSVKPNAGVVNDMSAQGGVKQDTEISIEFGDTIPEIAKEYVKNWIINSGLVNQPFARQYDVHNLKDIHNHKEEPSIVMLVPFQEFGQLEESKFPAIFEVFNSNPREFAKKYKVGNVRVYSRNKQTGESDALGYINYLPLKIIGTQVIGKDLKKAVLTRNDELRDPDEEAQIQMENFQARSNVIQNLQAKLDRMMQEGASPEEIDSLKEQISSKNMKLRNDVKSAESKLDDAQKKEMLEPIKAQQKVIDDLLENKERMKQNKENRAKELEILRDILDPGSYIAQNRGKGDLDPIGRAMQVAETSIKAPLKVLDLVTQVKTIKEDKEQQKLMEERNKLNREAEGIKQNPSKAHKIILEVNRHEAVQEKPTTEKVPTEPEAAAETGEREKVTPTSALEALTQTHEQDTSEQEASKVQLPLSEFEVHRPEQVPEKVKTGTEQAAQTVQQS